MTTTFFIEPYYHAESTNFQPLLKLLPSPLVLPHQGFSTALKLESDVQIESKLLMELVTNIREQLSCNSNVRSLRKLLYVTPCLYSIVTLHKDNLSRLENLVNPR